MSSKYKVGVLGASMPCDHHYISPHYISKRPLIEPYPQKYKKAVFGMGCFWGAERRFWNEDGIWITAVGYAGGNIPNPSYELVCRKKTGHAEIVLVVYDPDKISYRALLQIFWQSHDPTQGDRQGNDIGSQYRSLIMCFDETQRALAKTSRIAYQAQLKASDYGVITTDIIQEMPVYFAEDYHQQYLAKNPTGYCGLNGTGVSCPSEFSVQTNMEIPDRVGT